MSKDLLMEWSGLWAHTNLHNRPISGVVVGVGASPLSGRRSTTLRQHGAGPFLWPALANISEASGADAKTKAAEMGGARLKLAQQTSQKLKGGCSYFCDLK